MPRGGVGDPNAVGKKSYHLPSTVSNNNPTKPVVMVNRVASGGTKLAVFQGKSTPAQPNGAKSNKPRVAVPATAAHEPIMTQHNNDGSRNHSRNSSAGGGGGGGAYPASGPPATPPTAMAAAELLSNSPNRVVKGYSAEDAIDSFFDWGKGGSGAPLRDGNGRVITSRHPAIVNKQLTESPPPRRAAPVPAPPQLSPSQEREYALKAADRERDRQKENARAAAIAAAQRENDELEALKQLQRERRQQMQQQHTYADDDAPPPRKGSGSGSSPKRGRAGSGGRSRGEPSPRDSEYSGGGGGAKDYNNANGLHAHANALIRVSQPPGGASSIMFGNNVSYAQPQQQQQSNSPTRKRQITGPPQQFAPVGSNHSHSRNNNFVDNSPRRANEQPRSYYDQQPRRQQQQQQQNNQLDFDDADADGGGDDAQPPANFNPKARRASRDRAAVEDMSERGRPREERLNVVAAPPIGSPSNPHTRFRFENADPEQQRQLLAKQQQQAALREALELQLAEKGGPAKPRKSGGRRRLIDAEDDWKDPRDWKPPAEAIIKAVSPTRGSQPPQQPSLAAQYNQPSPRSHPITKPNAAAIAAGAGGGFGRRKGAITSGYESPAPVSDAPPQSYGSPTHGGSSESVIKNRTAQMGSSIFGSGGPTEQEIAAEKRRLHQLELKHQIDEVRRKADAAKREKEEEERKENERIERDRIELERRYKGDYSGLMNPPQPQQPVTAPTPPPVIKSATPQLPHNRNAHGGGAQRDDKLRASDASAAPAADPVDYEEKLQLLLQTPHALESVSVEHLSSLCKLLIAEKAKLREQLQHAQGGAYRPGTTTNTALNETLSAPASRIGTAEYYPPQRGGEDERQRRMAEVDTALEIVTTRQNTLRSHRSGSGAANDSEAVVAAVAAALAQRQQKPQPNGKAAAANNKKNAKVKGSAKGAGGGKRERALELQQLKAEAERKKKSGEEVKRRELERQKADRAARIKNRSFAPPAAAAAAAAPPVIPALNANGGGARSPQRGGGGAGGRLSVPPSAAGSLFSDRSNLGSAAAGYGAAAAAAYGYDPSAGGAAGGIRLLKSREAVGAMGDQSYAEATGSGGGSASARNPSQRLFPSIGAQKAGSGGAGGAAQRAGGSAGGVLGGGRKSPASPSPYGYENDSFLETKTEFIYPVAFPDAPIDNRNTQLLQKPKSRKTTRFTDSPIPAAADDVNGGGGGAAALNDEKLNAFPPAPNPNPNPPVTPSGGRPNMSRGGSRGSGSTRPSISVTGATSVAAAFPPAAMPSPQSSQGGNKAFAKPRVMDPFSRLLTQQNGAAAPAGAGPLALNTPKVVKAQSSN